MLTVVIHIIRVEIYIKKKGNLNNFTILFYNSNNFTMLQSWSESKIWYKILWFYDLNLNFNYNNPNKGTKDYIGLHDYKKKRLSHNYGLRQIEEPNYWGYYK